MSTPTSSASESEREEMKPITLATIPPLRYLYKNQTLKNPTTKPRFPHRHDLLDRVSLFQGDITRLEVDSIVNAANRSLLGGGGVDGAIHNAAGPGLVKECRTLGGADTGEAKITGGHKLPSKHIIHAVGPVYSSFQKDIKAAQLAACYSNSLDLALKHNLKSIAFCSISTGIYGYPIEAATHIALETTREILDEEKANSLERVIFVVWSDKDKHVYEELLPQYFPEGDAAEEGEEEEAHTGLSQTLEETTIEKEKDSAEPKQDSKDDKKE